MFRLRLTRLSLVQKARHSTIRYLSFKSGQGGSFRRLTQTSTLLTSDACAYVVHKCTFATLQQTALCGSAAQRSRQTILEHSRRRTEPVQKSAPTASLTSYCKIQGIYASPLLGRRLELAQRGDYRNSGHGGWPMLSASSKSSPLHKVVNITLVRTGTDLYHAISTVCTRVPSRREETALRREAGACIHVVVQTGSHLRYSSRRTS